jgi:NitT/TauT family transport system substrate-binding protein
MTARSPSPRGRYSAARRLASMAVLALALAACGGTTTDSAAPSGEAPSGSPDVVRLLQAAPNSMVFNVVFVGEELGYWEEAGIQIELQDAGDLSEIAFLDGGQTDLAFTGNTEILTGIAAGVDLRILYEFWQIAIEGIAVPADSTIQSVADLEGQTVGLASDSDLFFLTTALETAGVDPSTVEWVVVGEQGGVIKAALDRGDIVAMSGSTRDFRSMIGAGVELRDITPDELKEIPGQVFIAMADGLDDNQDVYERFFRAWAKAQYASLLNDEVLLAMGDRNIPESMLDRVQAVAGLNQAKQGSKPLNDIYGELRLDAWQRASELLVRAGALEAPVEVESYLDDRYIGAANDFDRAEVQADVDAWAAANL